MPDRLRSRSPRKAAAVSVSHAETVAPTPITPRKRAASLHPSSASATNPNRAKRHGARLPQKVRVTVPRDGVTRSGVTVMRVDPATLRRSTAGGRNISDKVLNGADVIARNVLSRRTLRKVAV